MDIPNLSAICSCVQPLNVLRTFSFSYLVADIAFTGGSLYGIVVMGGKAVAKTVMKTQTQKVVKKKMVELTKEIVAQSISKAVANQASHKVLKPFRNKQYFSKMQTLFGQTARKNLDEYVTFEITPMLNFLHK